MRRTTYRTALYGRTSRDDPRTVTIEAQQEALRKWATTDKEVSKVCGEYWDAGVSGKVPIAERPDGQRLLHSLDRGEVDSVGILFADRLGRTLLDGLQVAADLEKRGVKLVIVNEGWDARRNDDPLYFQFRLMMAEEEHRRICGRMADGKRRAADRDNAPPGGPLTFGYTMDARGAYVLDPVEAPVVMRIFEMAATGCSNGVILAWVLTLNIRPGRKYRKRSGGAVYISRNHATAKWHLSTIGKILRNRTYLGERRWGDRVFPCPALVDPDTFDRVQVVNRVRSSMYGACKGNPANGLLSGLLTCQCGTKFYHWSQTTRRRGGGKYSYPVYACDSTRKGRNCRAKLLPISALDAQVWAGIEQYLADPAALVRRVIAASDQLSTDASALDGEEQRLTESLQGIEDKVAEVWAEQASNDWPMPFVAPKLNALNKQRLAFTAQLDDISHRRATLLLTRDQSAEVTAAIAGIRARLQAGLTQEEKYHVARLLIAGGRVVTIGTGRSKTAEVTVELRYGDDLVCTAERPTPGFPNTGDREVRGMTLPVTFIVGRAVSA